MKYIGIGASLLCGSYWIVCGIVVTFFYGDLRTGAEYMGKALISIIVYILFVYAKEIKEIIKKYHLKQNGTNIS